MQQTGRSVRNFSLRHEGRELSSWLVVVEKVCLVWCLFYTVDPMNQEGGRAHGDYER